MSKSSHSAPSPPVAINTPRINVIGSGKLGRTLIRLFADHDLVQLGDFFNRSVAHSKAAIEFCGGGRICPSLTEMAEADIWLVATPDDAIADIASALASHSRNWANTLVFHASGLHSSALLAALKKKGALVASAHPVHSFADPEQSIISYEGTTCTIEGDPLAIEQLSDLFGQIGSTIIQIPSSGKALYHAATVMASNYLVALQQVAVDMLKQASIEQQQADQILLPLMTQSLQNIQNNGSINALTGPVARGDMQTLELHLNAIAAQDAQHLMIYKELGRVAVQLASSQAKLDETTLIAMAALFSDS